MGRCVAGKARPDGAAPRVRCSRQMTPIQSTCSAVSPSVSAARCSHTRVLGSSRCTPTSNCSSCNIGPSVGRGVSARLSVEGRVVSPLGRPKPRPRGRVTC
eukprot:scaffold84971_cov70-Phaeocystis_antarctica.AAC.4